jgi:hypothetical protein
MNPNADIAGVKIGVETVHIGDLVGENLSPWIKAMVIDIEHGVSKYTNEPIATLTVVWLADQRHGNHIARKGRTRKYAVNKYGVCDARKVA